LLFVIIAAIPLILKKNSNPKNAQKILAFVLMIVLGIGVLGSFLKDSQSFSDASHLQIVTSNFQGVAGSVSGDVKFAQSFNQQGGIVANTVVIVTNNTWVSAFAEAEQTNGIATRTFDLNRDNLDPIILGDCPNCMRFELADKFELKNGALIQTFKLSGERLGYFSHRVPGRSWDVLLSSTWSLDGARLSFNLADPEHLFLKMQLLNGASFTMLNKSYAIALKVIDTRVESLRIKLEIRRPTASEREKVMLDEKLRKNLPKDLQAPDTDSSSKK
jgi:hypothetical protein